MQETRSGTSYHNSKQATLRIFYSYHRVSTERIWRLCNWGVTRRTLVLGYRSCGIAYRSKGTGF